MTDAARTFLRLALSLGFALLMAACGTSAPAAGPADAAGASSEGDTQQLIRQGLEALQRIDAGRSGEVWDGASAAARQAVAREAFVRQIAQARAPLGRVQSRQWVAVERRVQGPRASGPPGEFVSLDYETRFTTRPDTALHERVVFQREADGQMRVAGYFIR